ncbi:MULTISPECIES: polysaccharide biosynthesis/export family protein [unclassified Rhizobium]|uniref:polysaccharide biosynthesis/export family protein n=1 Tax=unclassified Rhizobium TaxID=2613769 RepID=UPI001FD78043|nr:MULTISPECIES: polysaccharide biosynthesis/export family protein [unclassified Rhizobium]
MRRSLTACLSAFSRTPIGLAAFTAVLLAGSAHAAPLPALTRIKLTIVQWMPTKGTYEQWGAIGGEFTVSDAGTISMPVLGSIPVGDLDDAGLAADIAQRLKLKIGLVDAPTATVEILAYAPIYVVGDVNRPGEYKFSTGLTVLQALALGGGELRPGNLLQNSMDVTRLLGDIKELDDAILRSRAKIERLQAEMAGAKAVEFSKPAGSADQFTNAIYGQEQVIFAARTNALDRKSKSLTELRDLLTEEMHVLDEKTKSTDANIASIQQQVDSTAALVAKGAVVATRQAEVERALRSYQDDKLDIITAIMRARQNISQTNRDLQALYDERKTEVASELQAERASLVQLQVKRETAQKLMMDNLSVAAGSARPGESPPISFTIVRQKAEVEAAETTELSPGDVVKVTLHASQIPTQSADAQQSSTPGSIAQAGQ